MDGPAPVEEDFSALSIQDRLAHKNWKARVHAYESLIKAFANSASDSDPVFKPYISNPDLLKKIATDSNAVAQEKGVECLVSLVKFAGETAAKTREAVVPALVDKCFGSARAGTKAQAIELTLQYVEVENGGAGVVVRVISIVYIQVRSNDHLRMTFYQVWVPNSPKLLQERSWPLEKSSSSYRSLV
jgi:cytoskeleton-associated protein 5